MVNDFFQDIVPPDDPKPAQRPATSPRDPDASTIPIRVTDADASSEPQARSIRDITAPRARTPLPGRPTEMRAPMPPRRPSRVRPWLLWTLAGVCLAILGGLLLFVFRPTSVSIVPKSRLVQFDASSRFTALPASSAASGVLSYTVQSVSEEDSEVVKATGTTPVQTKASGSITVFNDYSASTVKLVKNTRFMTATGLVYRVPADVIVPGKTSSGPGSIQVSVVADQPGEQYNIGPVDRFSLPGLKTSPMYTKVYASSKSAMSGGFSGTVPAASPQDTEQARAQIRSRLEAKVSAAAKTESAGMLSLPPQVRYESLTNTSEGTNVRIRERAILDVIQIPEAAFARAIAQASALNTDAAALTLQQRSFTLSLDAASTTSTGSDPVRFSASGSALLVWSVDTAAISKALAGKDSSLFEQTISQFAEIEEATARIEPFWSKKFPSDPTKIQIRVLSPKAK